MNEISDLSTFLGIMEATIAPAMVISGLAVLLSLMASRYARCIDRTREVLVELNDEKRELNAKKKRALHYQLRFTYRRCRQLRNMMAIASTSLFLIVLTISCIFMALLFKWHLEKFAATTFISSLLCLCFSMGQFVRDIVISLYGIKAEIREVETEFRG